MLPRTYILSVLVLAYSKYATSQLVRLSWQQDFAYQGGNAHLTCSDTREHTDGRVEMRILQPNGLLCFNYIADPAPNITSCELHNLCALESERYETHCPAEITQHGTDVEIMLNNLRPVDIGAWACAVLIENEFDGIDIATTQEFVLAGVPSVISPEVAEGDTLELTVGVLQEFSCRSAFGAPSSPGHALNLMVERGPSNYVNLEINLDPAQPGDVFTTQYAPELADDGGVIFCWALQDLPFGHPAFERSNSFPVQVNALQAVTSEVPVPMNWNVLEGQPLVILCAFSGSPRPTVTVEGAGHPLHVEITYPLAGTVLANISWAPGSSDLERRTAHGRDIRCVGEQDYYIREDGNPVRVNPSVPVGTRLNVIHAPSTPVAVRVEPSMVQVLQPVTLTCEVLDVGNPPASEFQWMQRGEIVQRTPGNTWTFIPVDIAESGHVTCSCHNSPVELPQQHSGPSPPSALTVLVQAELTDMEGRFGDVIRRYDEPTSTFTCDAISFPPLSPADFRWFDNLFETFDTDPFSQITFTNVPSTGLPHGLLEKSRSTLTVTHNLPETWTCDNVEMYDRAYTCIVVPGDLQLFRTAVTTHYPALWRGNPWRERYLFTVGGDMELTCDVCMRPVGQFSWFHNGVFLNGENNRNIVRMRVDESVAGTYTCRVTSNIQGSEIMREFTTTVEIQQAGPGGVGGAVTERPDDGDIAVYVIMGVMGLAIIVMLVMMIRMKRAIQSGASDAGSFGKTAF